MTTTRFVPFRTLANPLHDAALLEARLNATANNVLLRSFVDFARGTADNSPATGTATLVPAVEFSEDAQNLVLTLEMPGVRREDLDIQMEGRTLTVKGERKSAQGSRSFARSFTLPASVDTEQISASHVDGILTLTLAHKAKPAARQIEVKASMPAQAVPQIDGTAMPSAEAAEPVTA